MDWICYISLQEPCGKDCVGRQVTSYKTACQDTFGWRGQSEFMVVVFYKKQNIKKVVVQRGYQLGGGVLKEELEGGPTEAANWMVVFS